MLYSTGVQSRVPYSNEAKKSAVLASRLRPGVLAVPLIEMGVSMCVHI